VHPAREIDLWIRASSKNRTGHCIFRSVQNSVFLIVHGGPLLTAQSVVFLKVHGSSFLTVQSVVFIRVHGGSFLL
jgi:hypothetical protein